MALKKDLVAVGIAALTGIGGYMVYKKRSAGPGIESDGAPKSKDSTKESKLPVPEDKEKRGWPEPDVKKTPDATDA